MGWHMKLVICVQLAHVSVCLTQLSVVHEWTSLDMQLPLEDGQESRRSIKPFEIKSWLLYKDRVFVTLFEQRYTLAHLHITDNSMSPLLQPYSSWEALMGYENQEILRYVPDKVRVGRCDRLWVIGSITGGYSSMIAFDLKTDNILRNSFFPHPTYSLDMTVDDFDCDNEYVYISNYGGVWTYSWAEEDLRRYISNQITSMVLAPNGSDSIVYYNKGNLSDVFSISTTHLRNKTSDLTGLERRRGLNVELASSALDAKRDVLYYFNDDNKTIIHAVPCWTSERCSSNGQDDIDVGFDPTHELMYIRVDENGYLWAITSRSNFVDGEINYRILSVPVKSKCVESNANDTTNTSTDVESNAKDLFSTVWSVPKNITVNVADTTAGTPNSNITQAIGGTKYMPYLLFSFANVTFNLSNFTITNFPHNHFH